MGTNRIFVNYRRDDTAAEADSIFMRLQEAFGDVVFKDVDRMPAGRDFREYVVSVVSGARVAVILVGTKWLKAQKGTGRSRLFDEDDTLRSEIEAALDNDCVIVPIHMRGVSVPKEKELPSSIRPICNVTWYQFDSKFAARDLQPVIDAIADVVPKKTKLQTPKIPFTPTRPENRLGLSDKYFEDMRKRAAEREKKLKADREAAVAPHHLSSWRWGLLISIAATILMVGLGEAIIRGLLAAIGVTRFDDAGIFVGALIGSVLIGVAAWAGTTIDYAETPEEAELWYRFGYGAALAAPAAGLVWAIVRGLGYAAAVNIHWDLTRAVLLPWTLVVVASVGFAAGWLVLAWPKLRDLGRQPAAAADSLAGGDYALNVPIALAVGVASMFAAQLAYTTILDMVNLEPVDLGPLAIWLVVSGVVVGATGLAAGGGLYDDFETGGVLAVGPLFTGAVAIVLWLVVSGATQAVVTHFDWSGPATIHLFWWLPFVVLEIWFAVFVSEV